MIKKINRIKDLGLVFSDFTWNPSTSDFKQFNLIYGLNGCGKTSLTRLFDAIGGEALDFLKYEIEDDGGFKYHEGDSFPRNIRVFNQNYIEKNVEIFKLHANPISVLLGEENKDLVMQIQADETVLNGDPKDPNNVGKLKDLNNYSLKRTRTQDVKDGKFTDVARIIGATTMGGTAARTYRSPEAKNDFYTLTQKELLLDTDLEKCLLAINQELLQEEPLLKLPKLMVFGKEQDMFASLETISAKAKDLLDRTIETEMITRLAENQDISAWVEQGIHIHTKYKSDICEYCFQKIPRERIEQLAGHFNDADKALKQEIDTLLVYLREAWKAINSIEIQDVMHFYEDLRVAFEEKRADILLSKKNLLEQISLFGSQIGNKKSQTAVALPLESDITTEDFHTKLQSMNELIADHNQKTKDFQKLKAAAIRNLKIHYLSTIFDEVKGLDEDIKILSKDIELCAGEVKKLQDGILIKKTKISSEHKACEVINTGLNTFLGRDELCFVPHLERVTDKDGTEREIVTGYDITRGGKPALNLSEGEKTAIAFVYFVVHLRDREFNDADGIVVIDDPISSLDSNSLFQAFSFLKNAVKDCEQVFILTHQFEFLKLLLNWRKHRSIVGKTGFYMITNEVKNNVRAAYIIELDKILREYESEYHYLFKLLKEMQGNQNGTLIWAYPVPNIARKVWDTFLLFRVPDGNGTYLKMDYLKQQGVDAQKLDAIYKFTNDQSHSTGAGFDPALVPETQKLIVNLLNMIKELDPEHFRIINKATN